MAIKEFLITDQTESTEKIAVEILEQHPTYFKFKINKKVFEISLENVKPKEYDESNQILNLVINNQPVKIKYAKQQDQTLPLNQEKFLLYIINHCTQLTTELVTQKPIKNLIKHTHEASQNIATTSPQAARSERTLKSPLAGRVVKVLVKVDDQVTKNQPLVIIESMKMENEIRASFNGFIKNISITEGNLVQQNQVLITFE